MTYDIHTRDRVLTLVAALGSVSVYYVVFQVSRSQILAWRNELENTGIFRPSRKRTLQGYHAVHLLHFDAVRVILPSELHRNWLKRLT